MKRGPFAAALLANACAASTVSSGTLNLQGCALDSECPGGYHCVEGGCQIPPRPCTASGQCDPGQSCQSNLCLPSNAAFCQACQTAADCVAGGLCLQLSGQSVCTASCAQCPSGASCQGVLDSNGNDAGTTCLPAGGSCQNQPDAGPPGLTYLEQNLFQPLCVVCHSAGAGAEFGNLDLVTNPYLALLGANGMGEAAVNGAGSAQGLLRVDPGNPQQSLLVIKLALTQVDPQYGLPMPTTAPDTTPARLQAIVQAWIAAGAPNN